VRSRDGSAVCSTHTKAGCTSKKMILLPATASGLIQVKVLLESVLVMCLADFSSDRRSTIAGPFDRPHINKDGYPFLAEGSHLPVAVSRAELRRRTFRPASSKAIAATSRYTIASGMPTTSMKSDSIGLDPRRAAPAIGRNGAQPEPIAGLQPGPGTGSRGCRERVPTCRRPAVVALRRSEQVFCRHPYGVSRLPGAFG